MNFTLSKLIFVVALSTLPLVANAKLSDEVVKLPGTISVGGAEIFDLGTSLVVVILAIIVVGWLYSRMQGIGHPGGDVINIVASRPLGPKERILLIEIADQQLLVGMTASQVQTLHIFEKPVVTLPTPSESPSESMGFAERLKTAVKEIGK